jgi:hypothetical protein
VHSFEEVETVKRLFEAGWNNCQVARWTGIPLNTIWNWRNGLTPRYSPAGVGKRASRCPRCDGMPLDEAAIRLEPWQQQIVGRYPRQLLRGLIHSDGCRVTNRVQRRRYAYPRYFFTNTSSDILQIFRDTCDALGIRHRDTKPTTISVARRSDVAILDAFIGRRADA